MERDKHLDQEFGEILEATTVTKAQEVMKSRRGLWIIGFVSFVESATPIPVLTDPFLIAGILLNRHKTALIILIATVASVLGGIFAYYTATFFIDFIMQWFTPEMTNTFNRLVTKQEDSGTFLLTLLGSSTPIPYTSTAYVVAFMKGNIGIFIIGSIIGRGFRYTVVGTLVHYFGPTAIKYAKRSIAICTVLLLILAGLYFWTRM